MRITGCLLAFSLLAGPAMTAQAPSPTTDFSGTWLPDARRAARWPEPLPLTPAARRFMETFDPVESDPTTYCMPFGTPRNMLQTGYPMEIVQTPRLIVLLVQPNLANAEVRRIRLDGRPLQAPVEPSWFGTSRGHWDGSTLVVETVGLRADALVSETGLPHSPALRVVERLRIVDDAATGRTLIDDIELHDPQSYTEPLRIRRFFSWAPDARPQEGHCVDSLWIDKLWRDRLQEHAEAVRSQEAGR